MYIYREREKGGERGETERQRETERTATTCVLDRIAISKLTNNER